MNIFTKEITIYTNMKNEMMDITMDIMNIIKKSTIKEGMVHVFVPHTTAAITINENSDTDVKKDMMEGLSKISPNLISYHHQEGNSDAHIKSSLFGVSEFLILRDSKLVLGTWQGIYFCEFDGPRKRQVQIQIIG